jgi:hypothetical protein
MQLHEWIFELEGVLDAPGVTHLTCRVESASATASSTPVWSRARCRVITPGRLLGVLLTGIADVAPLLLVEVEVFVDHLVVR